MKILLIGSGARENAIYDVLKKSRHNPEVFVFGKTLNPGMKEASLLETGDLEDLDAIKVFALKTNPDLAIIGPDNPIGVGVADVLKSLGIPTFAPVKSLARLESSKSFTRDLITKYQITGNPKFKVFTSESNQEQIIDFIQKELDSDYVVKYDALLGGKGVKLSKEHLKTVQDGLNYALECIAECGKVVIEEKFIGPEFSLLFFADGKTVVPMPVVQDHKRAYNNDEGPNTGGMGTFSDKNHLLPFITQDDLNQATKITEQIQQALKSETGLDYCGIMYGGFIKTKNGVKVIEYNARFGDPEAMNVIPLLDTDFVDIVLACIDQKLDSLPIKFKDLASVCLYIVPANYPDGPALSEQDKLITFEKQVFLIPDLYTYFASVDCVLEDENTITLKLSSSRALSFTGLAETIEQARLVALKGVELIRGKIFYRTDIGSAELINKKVNQVQTFQ